VGTNASLLETKRLRLRRWRESDLLAFAALNADARVMEFFPQRLDRAESDASAGRIVDHFDRHGFGLWAVEVLSVAPFVGFIGLCVPAFDAHFTPCVEIGWRLAYDHWGKGYASEGAGAALAYGFRELGLGEIVSMTAVVNERSQRVMQRIGMTHTPADDFDHPKLTAESPLCRHVLYRLGRDAWETRVATATK
jgi:RimJ/RimL family protein N-acetyltransferase